MVLIDTSAWIEFLNGSEPVASQVENLISKNEVAICPILQKDRDFENMAKILKTLSI